MNTVVIRSGKLSPAIEILRRGGLVAVPTETVYGLSADGLNGEAVAAVSAVKGRPAEKPVSLLVAGMEQAKSVCREIPREAYLLAAAFWPGCCGKAAPGSAKTKTWLTGSGRTGLPSSPRPSNRSPCR